MAELRSDELFFSFPAIHPRASCSISFQRTLRLPDEGTYPMPPSLGNFPLRRVPERGSAFSERGGVMLPMYQSEALWVAFNSTFDHERNVGYPFAIKIAAGKRSAVTGNAWTPHLQPRDYVWIPKQRWIDGFVVGEGIVRQFVAMPLGLGVTVEEQLSNEAEYGGLQIQVFPMKRHEYETRFPKPRPMQTMRKGTNRLMASTGVGLECAMGVAAGGKMKQQIHVDPHGIDVWDQTRSDRAFIHILNSESWHTITGENPPSQPYTAEEYTSYGLPWFDSYLDGPMLSGTVTTQKIQSLGEIKENLGAPKVEAIHIPANQVKNIKDGNW